MLTAISMSAIATNGVVPGERVGWAGHVAELSTDSRFAVCSRRFVLHDLSLPGAWVWRRCRDLLLLGNHLRGCHVHPRLYWDSAGTYVPVASRVQGQNSTCGIFTTVASPTYLLLHPIAPHPPSFVHRLYSLRYISFLRRPSSRSRVWRVRRQRPLSSTTCGCTAPLCWASWRWWCLWGLNMWTSWHWSS